MEPAAAPGSSHLGAPDLAPPVPPFDPTFLEAMLKAYRVSERGATMIHGKTLFDKQGRPIMPTSAETVTQTLGFRPERLAREAGSNRTEKNVERYWADKRQGLYDRYAIAAHEKKESEMQRVNRDAQQFNLEAQKCRGFVTPISSRSLKESMLHRIKPAKQQLRFGREYSEARR